MRLDKSVEQKAEVLQRVLEYCRCCFWALLPTLVSTHEAYIIAPVCGALPVIPNENI